MKYVPIKISVRETVYITRPVPDLVPVKFHPPPHYSRPSTVPVGILKGHSKSFGSLKFKGLPGLGRLYGLVNNKTEYFCFILCQIF